MVRSRLKESGGSHKRLFRFRLLMKGTEERSEKKRAPDVRYAKDSVCMRSLTHDEPEVQNRV